jgi:hypothetical protein
VSGVDDPISGEVVLGGGAGEGWWLVVGEEDGPGRVVAGPFADRAAASWAAAAHMDGRPDGVRPCYGIRRADGGLDRLPSPQEWAWFEHMGELLERLPGDWDALLYDDDPLTTLVVEVAAALSEAGLPLYDATGTGGDLGGACVSPEPELGGVVVTWRQHDRMSLEQVHGAAADVAVQHVMNRALADVLTVRGFDVEPFGGASGHVVRTGV